MIGIVIVSHSARLAEGVAELVRGMGGEDVRVATAGGLDAPGEPLGTDAIRVLEAIQRVDSADGVLVLMDLGSAVLSAETALDLLPPERRGHVLLCEAPLVEGAVAAAAQARLGSPLERAAAEARASLEPKRSQLAGLAPQAELAQPREPGTGRHELRLPVRNRLGVHARPAARLVQLAGRFPDADLRLSNATTGKGPVSARSLNGVTTLAVRTGQELLAQASGPTAAEALEAVRALVDSGFGDEDSAAGAPVAGAPRAGASSGAFAHGIAVSPGMAVGPARHLRRRSPAVPAGPRSDPGVERSALERAVQQARRDIAASRDAMAARAGPAAAAILEAHLLSLDDEALLAPARESVAGGALGAAAAWSRSVERVAAEYRALDDPLLRSRAADVEDVGRQVLTHLVGAPAAELPAEPGVLLADELTAADAARLDPERVHGIATARGGPTSHGAILARALGIPAVAGAGPGILAVPEGIPIVLDGATGQVWIDPAPDRAEAAAARAETERSARAAARAAGVGPAVTRDGRRVEVVANVASAAETRAAVASGAEGVGVLRTEFLFQGRAEAPGEEEQLAAYRGIAEALDGRPLVIRTLDAGGDKPLPYLDLGPEANPFLGWRAIRPCLARPDFFKVQLRAIVRAAAGFPVRALFPMIATLAEWRAARALLDEARAEVLRAGHRAPDRVSAGIMVEIPSAALRAGAFAREVDFLSIGTNDLIQYTLAAERGNPRLAALSDPFQPAVLELIRQVAEAGRAARKPVAVCGEMAADPAAAVLLVGLGIDELSMSAPAIPAVKQAIRSLSAATAREVAARALALDSPEEIRALLAGVAGIGR
jgi:phosphocarrier protein FPr